MSEFTEEIASACRQSNIDFHPIDTATPFDNAASTKMVHICEFTADLLRHRKLRFDPGRNDHWRVTFHDSCNPARAMGLLEEPEMARNLAARARRSDEKHDWKEVLPKWESLLSGLAGNA